MLDLPVPEVEYHNIAVKPSQVQKDMVAYLGERAEKIRGGSVDSNVDNMLKVTNDGRKLALDRRMMNPMLPDEEGSKVNACVNEVFRIWEENSDKKLTQILFCDLSRNYMLRVRGESMINAGIFDGDLILVEQAETARNGEIVVAMVDGFKSEATVKTFHRRSEERRVGKECRSRWSPYH